MEGPLSIPGGRHRPPYDWQSTSDPSVTRSASWRYLYLAISVMSAGCQAGVVTVAVAAGLAVEAVLGMETLVVMCLTRTPNSPAY